MKPAHSIIIANGKGRLFANGVSNNLLLSFATNFDDSVLMYLRGTVFAVNVAGTDILYFVAEGADPVADSYTLDTLGRIVGTLYYPSAGKREGITFTPYAIVAARYHLLGGR